MSEVASTTAKSDIRLMRMSEVLSLTGIKSRSTVYELQASGDFPQAVRLTGKAIGFVEAEVHGWIRSRIEARPAPGSQSAPADQPTHRRGRLPVSPATMATTGPAISASTPAAPPSPAPKHREPARMRALRAVSGTPGK